MAHKAYGLLFNMQHTIIQHFCSGGWLYLLTYQVVVLIIHHESFPAEPCLLQLFALIEVFVQKQKHFFE